MPSIHMHLVVSGVFCDYQILGLETLDEEPCPRPTDCSPQLSCRRYNLALPDVLQELAQLNDMNSHDDKNQIISSVIAGQHQYAKSLIDFTKLSTASMNKAICHRHHHRRPAVAIRFNKTYLNRKYQDSDVIMSPTGDISNDDFTIRRPPTPYTERILKGEFDFL